jgi:hypothetical protein
MSLHSPRSRRCVVVIVYYIAQSYPNQYQQEAHRLPRVVVRGSYMTLERCLETRNQKFLKRTDHILFERLARTGHVYSQSSPSGTSSRAITIGDCVGCVGLATAIVGNTERILSHCAMLVAMVSPAGFPSNSITTVHSWVCVNRTQTYGLLVMVHVYSRVPEFIKITVRGVKYLLLDRRGTTAPISYTT